MDPSLWDRDRGPSVSFEARQNQPGRQPQHGKSQLQLHFGPGDASGAIRQFWNPPGRQPQHGKSQLQRQFGSGEPFGIGTGGHPSVLKPDKTSQGANRHGKSELQLHYGPKPLGSGAGAIRQFWNPIKPARAPTGMAKASSNYIMDLSLWDRDRGPSVSFETR